MKIIKLCTNIIKNILYFLFGDDIGSKIKRIIKFYLSGKKKINSVVELREISICYHTSCGYYDFDPVRNGKLLFITSGKNYNEVNINKYDLQSKQNKVIEKGYVLNWQQGNRLLWINDNTFIFNNFLNNRYISEEIRNNDRVIHKFPIYDVSSNIAVSVDFNRLGWMRPGYGYRKFQVQNVEINDVAFTFFDLNNDKIIKKILYGDIIYQLKKQVNLNNCYINHLKFSPDGKKLMFFFIEIVNGRHMCYLSLYQNNQILILDKELCASHYTWRNNEELLVTSYDNNRNCNYYIYNIVTETREIIMRDKLKTDGHPTFIDATRFITDTYPDSCGFQKILYVDIERSEIKELVSIYSSAKHLGEKRCDLHPRVSLNSGKVYFDADIDGKRRIYVFKLEDIQK